MWCGDIQSLIMLLIVTGQPLTPGDVHLTPFFGLTDLGDNIIMYTCTWKLLSYTKHPSSLIQNVSQSH